MLFVSPDSSRRGSIYVTVVGAAMAVAAIGLSALMAARINRTASLRGNDFSEARFYAHSGIEMGFHTMNNDGSWRNKQANGVWQTKVEVGRGTYSLSVVDPLDSDFSNNLTDHTLLTGTGEISPARYNLSVEAEPNGPPGLTCLSSAIHTKTLLRIPNYLVATAVVSSSDEILIDPSGTVDGRLEAVVDVRVDGTLNGTFVEGVNPREIPGPGVFDYYVAAGTAIPITDIPENEAKSARVISQVVISPGSNPYGEAKNARGLYVIDCQDEILKIQDTRIHGSLVILNPGSGSVVAGGIHWEPFDITVPTLLVNGKIDFAWTGPLNEYSKTPANFNPVGTPFEGVSDADTTGVYPGTLKGLILVWGDFVIAANESITGVVLCMGGKMEIEGRLRVIHDPYYADNPPVGFEGPHRHMVPIAGTWKQVVD